jgi:hypothetical protein
MVGSTPLSPCLQLYYWLTPVDPFLCCKWVMVFFMHHFQCWKYFFATSIARLIHLFWSWPKIRTCNHIANEIAFYNSYVLAMDCLQKVVASCSETSNKTFLSPPHIYCNPTSG